VNLRRDQSKKISIKKKGRGKKGEGINIINKCVTLLSKPLRPYKLLVFRG